MRIIYPKDVSKQKKILDKAQKYEKDAFNSKNEYDANISKMTSTFLDSLEH